MEKSPKGLKRYGDFEVSLGHQQKIKKVSSEENIASLNIPTYSDMICHAIRELGGASVLEITNFIQERYPQIVTSKTTTWRNSVAGCLSANRRRVFVKEPVKKGAKRYIWKLRDMISDNVEFEPDTGDEDEEDERYDEDDEDEDSDPPSEEDTKRLKVESNAIHNGTVMLVRLALLEMGRGTMDEITEFIVYNRREFGVDKHKLHSLVTAMLLSSDYENIFAKEMNDGNIVFRAL